MANRFDNDREQYYTRSRDIDPRDDRYIEDRYERDRYGNEPSERRHFAREEYSARRGFLDERDERRRDESRGGERYGVLSQGGYYDRGRSPEPIADGGFDRREREPLSSHYSLHDFQGENGLYGTGRRFGQERDFGSQRGYGATGGINMYAGSAGYDTHRSNTSGHHYAPNSSPFSSSAGGGMGTGYGTGSSGAVGGGLHAGRGPRGYQRGDERIREDVCERLMMHGDIDATDVEVRVEKGEVTLTGGVPDRFMKRHAEDVVHEVSGVREVHNHLRVQHGAASSTVATTTSTAVEPGTSTGSSTGVGVPTHNRER